MIDQTIAGAAFNASGLDAMGAASGQLAAAWAEGLPTYDAGAMTLQVASPDRWHAPIGGLLQWHKFGAPLTNAQGARFTGVVAVFSFHPQAALRLRRLIRQRYDGLAQAARPTPWYAAITGGEEPAEMASIQPGDPPLAPTAGSAGTGLTHGVLSFHDERGLIIDPVAVAAIFRDLMQNGFRALRNPQAGGAGDLNTNGNPGGVGRISTLGNGTRVQIATPFGGPWTNPATGPGLRIGASGSPLGAGPADWPSDTIQPTTPGVSNLRFGFYPEGLLRNTPLSLPTFPATPVPAGSTAPSLSRQFFRVVAVDLGLHLLGNRGSAMIEEVRGADGATRLEPAPLLRDGDAVEVLFDGQATTGAITEIGALPGLALAVSPAIATDVAFPANRASRWPQVPPAVGAPEDLAADQSRRAREEGVAAYVGATGDVVVTWPAGALPRGAHVRVFPRVDPGPAVVPLAELDFALRGEGGSAIAADAGTSVLVKDPFRLRGGPRPADPTLGCDLLIVTRGPRGVRGRILGGLRLAVGTGGAAPARPPASNAIAAVPADQRGVSAAPVLGLPPASPAAGSDPVLAALGEAAPREAPRFVTMARTESVFAAHDGGAPGNWAAVATPGFLNGRSVRDDARLGNPGNDAGPEDHAPGLLATGRLALDLARAALRRTHHLVRRVPELVGQRWADPTPGVGTIASAVLQNVAEIVESPELSLIPINDVRDLPNDLAEIKNRISPFLPPGMSQALNAVQVPPGTAADRIAAEIRREAFAAKQGRRDSQWALRWALSHARDLVYVESPLFGATAAGTEDHEVDLVALLAARLTAVPDLRVVIVVPKRVPFGPGYESFAQRHHLARNAAIAALRAAAPKRVVVYHPFGFPGRNEVIRGLTVTVDDVWALLGTSSWSRRGLTFDGSIDVCILDRQLREGVSATIADLRRRKMARTLGVAPPVGNETPNAVWVRTLKMRSAFEVVREMIERGGDGLVEPLWPGLPEIELPALQADIADPDGRGFRAISATFAAIIAGLGPSGV
jgi:phosphatidylserine/phosphatidylglycerophosphate/cardiolipin synthase-like enzyme